MPRMIDLIRESAVSANLMRTAARGALSLPADETLEVLVFLTKHPAYSQQARLTLAQWDVRSALAVLSDLQAPVSVLDYFAAGENRRPALVPALLENPGVAESRLLQMAQDPSRELLEMLLASARMRSLPNVMRALLLNPSLTDEENGRLTAELERMGALVSDAPGQDILEPELSRYLEEHAAEIAAEDGKPFQLVSWTAQEEAEVAALRRGPERTPSSGAGVEKAGMTASAAAAHAMGQASREEHHDTRQTPVQRISKMSVAERVLLALRGDKDERLILIRDGAKIVSRAVLDSPKITEEEVENFASLRNVSETVLRLIGGRRRFLRNYAVKRILTSNPKCPPDVAMPLAKELLVMDLRNLSHNRDVAENLRRFAEKLWKERVEQRAR